MTCSRCSAALVTPEQAERGLCAMCLTGASLSALVGIAAQREAFHRDPKLPIYFSNHDGGNYVRLEGEWKRDTFPQETQ